MVDSLAGHIYTRARRPNEMRMIERISRYGYSHTADEFCSDHAPQIFIWRNTFELLFSSLALAQWLTDSRAVAACVHVCFVVRILHLLKQWKYDISP